MGVDIIIIGLMISLLILIFKIVGQNQDDFYKRLQSWKELADAWNKLVDRWKELEDSEKRLKEKWQILEEYESRL